MLLVAPNFLVIFKDYTAHADVQKRANNKVRQHGPTQFSDVRGMLHLPGITHEVILESHTCRSFHNARPWIILRRHTASGKYGAS